MVAGLNGYLDFIDGGWVVVCGLMMVVGWIDDRGWLLDDGGWVG